MRNLAQEIFGDDEDRISEDEVDDNAAIDGAFGDDVDTLDSDLREIESLETKIQQLGSAAIAIENFGINPTSYQILKTTGLMSGTALESLALESIGVESYTSDNSQIALEALLSKAKEKAVQWSAKILSLLTTSTKKVIGVLEPIWTFISDKVKALGSASWEKATKAGAYVKAHPVKTILAVLAAAGTVAGILAYSGKFPAANSTGAVFKSFMDRTTGMFRSIKWPFGKVKTTYVMDGKVAIATVETAEQIATSRETLGTLGWTSNQVKSVGSQVARIWKTITSSIGSIWTRVISPFKKISALGNKISTAAGDTVKEKTGSKAAAWVSKFVVGSAYSSIVWKFFGHLYRLVKMIIVKAFTMVRDTFKVISNFLL